MRSIVKCIYEHSLKTPGKTAVITADKIVDYKTFWQYILGVSWVLKQNNIRKGDRVILEASHTIEFLVCCYAIHLAGAVHVPVENNIPENRIREIANEIEPSFVITGKNLLEKLGTSFELLEKMKIHISEYMFPAENQLQEILFTTGTTGKSKGVMITHYAQMNMCESQNKVLNYSENNVWLIPSPMNHAAGLRKTHMSMVRGSTVLLMDGFRNLKLFFDNMRKYKVTSLYLPPSAVHYILLLAGKEFAKFDSQLDFLYSSSSALPSGDKEKLVMLLPHVRKFDAYGGSEVGAVVYIDYNKGNKPGNCVGKPNPGVDVFTVDEAYTPVKATKENPGIIAIKSNTVTAGYWNEPELTKKTIQNGVVYMSDLGYFDEEGYLYLAGRRDDVINFGGLKVAPTEVEDVALRYPTIADCVCIPYESKLYGLCIKMFVVMKNGHTLNTKEIAEYLKTKLEAYKVPKFIEPINEIPKTFNGKTDRKKLINSIH